MVTRHTPYDDLPEWLLMDEVMAYLDMGRTATYDAANSGQWGRVLRGGRLMRVHKSAFAPADQVAPIVVRRTG